MKNTLDIMNNIKNNELETFLSKTDSKFLMNSHITLTKVDYSFIDVLEDTLPNLEKIIRNPKRFLEQEEEVVIVEKTKKISKETITHLATHSQNINDVDKDGSVRPKKLLNVYKEDTTDLYENRFIYTLFKRLDEFIDKQIKYLEVISKKEIDNDITYNAKTNIDKRIIDIELKMKEHNEVEVYEDIKNLKDRLLAYYEIIKGFASSQFIKELIGCSLIKGPVRKTNLILKEPNFQKAYILWEYLDEFEYKEPKVVDVLDTINESDEIKKEFDLALFIEANSILEDKERFMDYRDFNSKLHKLIEEYLYEEKNNIDDFIELSKQYYIESLNIKKTNEDNISKIYLKFINNHNNIKNELNELFN